MKKILLWAALIAGIAVGNGCKERAVGGIGGPARPPTQVIVVKAERTSVSDIESLVGTLAANEMVEIKTETDGTVETIYFEEGQPVEAGDLLIELDASKLEASLEETKANFQLSQANFERAKQLSNDQLISQQEYDQAAAAFSLNKANVDLRERQLKDAKVRAPFAGIVGARNVSPGQVISKNSTLTWLVDLDPVKVEFNPQERLLSELEVGQMIEVTVAAYPGRTFTGKVFFVSPYVDPATRTSLVKAEIANPERLLKPGMFANLDLILTIRENAIVIPEVALAQVRENNQAVVFVVDQEQIVQARPVRLGVRLAGRVEVVEGLDEGEAVIVEGVQKVGPGSKVQFAPEEKAKPYSKAPSGGAG